MKSKRISERKDARETLYDMLFKAAIKLTVEAVGGKGRIDLCAEK